MVSEQQVQTLLQGLAAFLCVLAPCSAWSFYISMNGFYIKGFQSRPFFMAMLIAAHMPGPIISCLGNKYDAFFDKKYGTQTTFFFRIVWLQVALALSVALWMYLPQTPLMVLAIGFVFGAILQAVTVSSVQMVASMEPKNINIVFIGAQIGGLLPVALMSMFEFEPSSSFQLFRIVISPLLLVCITIVSCLSYFHFHLGVFEKAYSRLSYSLSSGGDDHDEIGNCAFDRQITETKPLSPDGPYKGVPSWVWRWSSVKASFAFIQALVFSFIGFLGEAKLAQDLALCKLVTDFMGRLLILPIRDVPGFEDGPWHKVLICNFCAFLLAAMTVFAKLLGFSIASPALLFAWCSICMLDNVTDGLVDVTCSAYVTVEERKEVSQQLILGRTVSFFLGLIGGLAVIFAAGKIKGEWPEMMVAMN